jgi:hypothetical protein
MRKSTNRVLGAAAIWLCAVAAVSMALLSSESGSSTVRYRSSAPVVLGALFPGEGEDYNSDDSGFEVSF